MRGDEDVAAIDCSGDNCAASNLCRPPLGGTLGDIVAHTNIPEGVSPCTQSGRDT